jgi:hypothetical protein
MASFYDIQQWEYIQQKASNNNLQIEVSSSGLCLKSGKTNIGTFRETKDLFNFLCGFEWGASIK